MREIFIRFSMITEINRIKQSPVFKEEANFFLQHRDIFTQSLLTFLETKDQYKSSFSSTIHIAESFYDAFFDSQRDCFSRHLEWIKLSNDNNIGFFFSSLIYDLLEAFVVYNGEKNQKQLIALIKACAAIQQEIINTTKEKECFDVSPHLQKQEGIIYLRHLSRLERGIRFITHTELGTCSHIAFVQQLGQHSAIMQVSSEQMTMMLSSHSSFILQNSNDEKNFSVETEILCIQDNTVIIKNLKELESSPLLSRKYPRAAIIHTSLVHIANENEYISGNMIDIGQGGIGVISSSKSDFKKGQNIVAFLSYEDKETEFKFSFEASGIISSIIGQQNAFRYGIQLLLNEKESNTINNLIEILNTAKTE